MQHICCSSTGSANLLQNAPFNKFRKVAVRCTFRYTEERLVFRISDPPSSLEVDQWIVSHGKKTEGVGLRFGDFRFANADLRLEILVIGVNELE